MKTNTIPQKQDFKHPPIAHLLAYGDQQKLANNHKTSKSLVNAVVNGNRWHPEIYAEAIEMAEAEQLRQKKIQQLAEKAGKLLAS